MSSPSDDDFVTYESDDNHGPDYHQDGVPYDPEPIYPPRRLERQLSDANGSDQDSDDSLTMDSDNVPTDTYRPTFYAPEYRPDQLLPSRDPDKGTDLPYPDEVWDEPEKIDGAANTGSMSDKRMKNYKPKFPKQSTAPKDAPNILLIMTDDVGFGAASTFGGPAHTPTMSRLADEGLIYNGFNTTAICSSTRAALLTGRQPHNVSTGFVVDSATGFQGYYSQFPKSCATVGELLKLNGYSTAWFGKNHNTPPWETSASGPFHQWPTGLGFERFYGFMAGEADQYHPLLYDDTVPIQPSVGKPDYHLDTDLKDKCIEFIKSRNALTPDKPWFAFYAPGATHAPHHVTEEYLSKYINKPEMKIGWDKMRERTLEMQKRLGVVPPETKCSKRPVEIGSWDDATQDVRDKELYTRMMEVYCGFLDMTDHNIGKIIDTLDDLNIADNTLVIYIQGDNGGSAEGTLTGSTNELAAMLNNVPEPEDFRRNAKNELGRPTHFNHLPVGWAWALNSPMQWAKRFASHFGGTRNGMVVRWPACITPEEPFDPVTGLKSGKRLNLRTQFLHVVDIVPTILDAAGVQTPINKVNGFDQKPFDGKSFRYTFSKDNLDKNRHKEMAFEMAGTFGFYQNGWMLSSTPKEFPWLKPVKEKNRHEDYFNDINWELYNVHYDFSQAYNLLHPDHVKANSTGGKPNKTIESYKERRDKMVKAFQVHAEENNIFPYAATGSDRVSGMVGAPTIADGYGEFIYHGKITRIPEACAPQCKNVSFKIEAMVDFDERKMGGKAPHGLIYAMGGRYCGFALYVWNGVVKFVYKLAHWPSAIFKLTAKGSDELCLGENKVTFDFDYKRKNKSGGPAAITLLINGEKQERKRLSSTVSKFYSVTECLDIGEASGTAVADEYAGQMPFALNGTIISVKFIVEDTLSTAEKLKNKLAEIQFDQEN